MSALLHAYRLGTAAVEPLALPALLSWRARAGKEDPRRLGERRGRAALDRPPGPLVWAHGASLGEALSLLPLVEALRGRRLHVLVTAGTRTAAEVMARRLPPGALHQYAPLDAPAALGRFLAHWRPGLALAAESEIWPNTLVALERAGVPLVLVNGRLSARSHGRWARVPALAGAVFGRVALALAQTRDDAARLADLGVRAVAVPGNLKFDVAAPPADPAALARLSGRLAGRPVWVAASTHPGEEAAALAAHRALAARHPRLMTVIAPRHPERGEAVAGLAAAAGLTAARRSRGEAPGPETAVYVADTVGELGLLYRLSPVVFLGGSLVPPGGHNPIEPAKLGAALLHGPRVRNFAAIYADLDAAGAALPVADAEELAAALAGLLADPGRVRAMARAAAGVVEASGGAVSRTMDALAPYLAPLEAQAAR